jgi:hypothetical protein
LPAGITIATNGTISGTPSEAGDFPFTFRVTDRNGVALTRSLTLRVQRQGLSISNSNLPAAQRGLQYSQQLTAAGGTPPYNFQLLSGNLPQGLALSAGGLLQGTPTVAGQYRVRIRVTDSLLASGEVEISLTVSAAASPLTLSSSGLTLGSAYHPYSARVEALGGSGGYRYVVTQGTLPAGLRLKEDGQLAGIPLQGGNYSLGLQVRDSAGAAANATVELRIEAPVVMPMGKALSTYSQRIGTGGTRYEIDTESIGKLPLGIRLDSDGTLSGFLWVSGEHIFSVRKTIGASTTRESVILRSLPEAGSFQVEDWSIGQGKAGSAYRHALKTSEGGSPASTTWKIVDGGLAPGLTLTANGVIEGTPL